MTAIFGSLRLSCNANRRAAPGLVSNIRSASRARATILPAVAQQQFTAPQSTAPPLIYPESPSLASHHDLPSFIRHAERTGLDTKSTVYVGTLYEYTVADHLRTLGFALQRIGGAWDRGIDLIGTWEPPIPASSSHRTKTSPVATYEPVRVLVQCKAGARQRIGPSLVRELEGAFIGAPAGWKSHAGVDGSLSRSGAAVLGMLITERPATKGIRDALARSHWPLAYICCSNAGHIQQMLWNQVIEKSYGLAGLGVTLRYSTATDGSTAHAHIVLTWHGKPLPLVTSQTRSKRKAS